VHDIKATGAKTEVQGLDVDYNLIPYLREPQETYISYRGSSLGCSGAHEVDHQLLLSTIRQTGL
jgi:hypothetical protein